MKMNWTKSEVGCYWQGARGFHIATRTTRNITQGTKSSGYVLYHDFNELGIYQTLEDAQAAGNRASMEVF